MKTCKCYDFMAEIADRRTSKYKELERELDLLTKLLVKILFRFRDFLKDV